MVTDPQALGKEAVIPPPFGPGFDIEVAVQADRMEVRGTHADEGEHDYVEFRLLKMNRVMAVARVPGY